MSSFLLRSLQQSCCRRLPQPVASSFVVPRQNYLIVYSPGDTPPEYATRARITKYEIQKRALRDDEDNETHEYGSDPYPFFRKEHLKRKEARFQGARTRNGRASIRKVRGLVDFIELRKLVLSHT